MTKSDILLVEPNELLAQPVIDVLIEAGYRVRHARTGRSALLQEAAAIT
ncbi:sigma-54-dependent Fis family transcriptional regulator, partial [Vibrio fluvialis]|nr:sigma-54-dependent Fis family transcriptional regulator [Vibrio fluvialis]